MSLTALPGRTADLLEVVGKLWPDSEVRLTGRRARRERSTRQLVVLPDATRARALLPAYSPAAASTASRRYSHDLSARRRLGRHALSLVLRTGVQDHVLPHRVEVSASDDNIETHLSELFGQEVVVSIGVGTARANRKPVLEVLTAKGRPLAFVKVGDSDVARDLVRAEHSNLRAVAARRITSIDSPRVLHQACWRDLELLVLSPLRTGVRSHRSPAEVPVAAMRDLSRSSEPRRLLLDASAFFARLTAVPASLGDQALSDSLSRVVQGLGNRHGDDELEFGSWHGDWTPWNMWWGRDPVRLWDWERYDDCVPVGFDLLHYRSQVAIRRQARATLVDLINDASDGLDVAFGLPRSQNPLAARAYLVDLAARYCTASEGSIGHPLRERTRELLRILVETER